MKIKRIAGIFCALSVLISSICSGAVSGGRFNAFAASNDVQVEDFEGNNPVHYVLDGISVTGTEEDSALKYTGGMYAQFPVRLNNIELRPNTKYAVSFKYKLSGRPNKPYLMAGNNASNWNFYGGENPAAKSLNGSTPLTGITGNSEWTTYSTVIDTGTVVNDSYKYLCFYVQSGSNSFEMYLDDFTVYETANDTDGVVIYKSSNGDYAAIAGAAGTDANVPNGPDTADGKQFLKWYTDKGLTQEFGGKFTEGTTLLYAEYGAKRDEIFVEDFEGNNPVHYVLDGISVTDSEEGNVLKYTGGMYAQFPVRLNNIELRPNTKYAVSFKYKLSGRPNKPYLMAGNNASNWNFYGGENPTAKSLNGSSPLTGITGNSEWTTYSTVIDTGTVVNDSYKYLCFYIQSAGSSFEMYLDDFTVCRVENEADGVVIYKNSEGNYAAVTGAVGTDANVPNGPDSADGKQFLKWYTDKGLTQEFGGKFTEGTTLLYAKYGVKQNDLFVEDFGGENPVHYALDGISVTGTEEDSALKYTGGMYAQFPVRLNNIELKPNTKYAVSFKYKLSGRPNKPYLMAGNNASNWNFYGGENPAAKSLNGSTPLTGITGNSEWTTYSTVINTGTVVNDSYKYLCFYVQSGSNSFEMYLDDFTVYETANDTDGVVIYKNSEGDYEAISGAAGTDANVPNGPDSADGKQFLKWYADKGLTQEFGGKFTEGTTLLYAEYGAKQNEIFVEDFENDNDPIHYALDGISVANGYKNKFVKFSGSTAYAQFPIRFNNIILRPETKYTVTFKYKLNGRPNKPYLMAGNNASNWNFYGGENPAAKSLNGSAPLTGITGNTEWTTYSTVIDTGTVVDNSYKYLCFYIQSAGNSLEMYIDDLTVNEVTNENDGFIIYKNNDGKYTGISGAVGAEANIPNASDLPDDEFVEWTIDKKLSQRFGGAILSGTTLLYPKYKSDTEFDGDYVAPYMISGYRRFEDRGVAWSIAYICDDADNLITNGGFEEDGNWNQSTLMGSGDITVTTDKAHSGKKALHFKTQNVAKPTMNIMYIDVKPNTDYYFTVFARAEQRDSVNKNDIRFGIVDPYNGEFIKTSNRNYEVHGLFVSSDDAYHIVRFNFNSGNAKRIGIGFKGASSSLFVDDMYLFESTDAKLYNPPLRDMKSVTVTSSAPEKLDCDDNKNLIENGDFSDDDISFWESAGSYGYTAQIENTGTTRGKAMHYTANLKYTGNPKKTYLIKWIEVEPNTEYTFTAEYSILKAGNGGFGMINGNYWHPDKILMYEFSDEDIAEDSKWTRASFSFNTSDYKRVGFFVYDGGGEAYVDNIKLFKTSDGKTLNEIDDFPDRITSDTFTVSGDVMIGYTLGQTVKSVLEKLDHNEYIRVFKGNTEITDYSVPLTIDMQFALMNGFETKHRVSLYMLGDTDGNLAVNTEDVQRLANYLCTKAGLDVYGEYAANVNGKTGIDVDDLAVLLLAVNGKVKLK